MMMAALVREGAGTTAVAPELPQLQQLMTTALLAYTRLCIWHQDMEEDDRKLVASLTFASFKKT